MKLAAAGLAAGLGIALSGALAGAAWAEPQVVVKCDGPAPDAMRWTRETDWKPYPNPLRSVVITGDNNKYLIEVTGEDGYRSHTVFALPVHEIKAFRVMRSEGNELFHLEKGPDGKPLLKRTIRGGRDGSHLYNIREMILANCPVISPDVVVGEPQAAGAGG
jgi:hypothetical protein